MDKRHDEQQLSDEERVLAAVRLLEQANIDKRNGLPESLFLCISSLIPIANVDLFILNKSGQLLLSYRDDAYFGCGWHIPGGCLRFGETMSQRIHKTAISELGVDVKHDTTPLAVRDVIKEPFAMASNPDVRGHNLAVMFLCRLSSEAEKTVTDGKSGRLAWFEKIPPDILQVHSVYNDIFERFHLR